MDVDLNIYIALFRGINVGGRNILPMKDLVGILEGMGFEDVSSYIQSGNVVFRSKNKCSHKTATEIGAKIQVSHGFEPKVLLLQESELEAAIENNPFDNSEGKFLHFFFLDSVPKEPDLDSLKAVKSKTEKYELINKVFYLYAPDGIGRSKLAAKVEKAMGVPGTGRNWNTVNKLVSMVRV